MLTDSAMRLATLESIPNGGASPGGLGGNSVTGVAATPYYIDTASTQALGMSLSDLASCEDLEMSVSIGTGFTGLAPGTLEFRLVSLPILPTSLTSATTSGKTVTITGLTAAFGTDLITTASGLNLPVAQPVYFTGTQGTTTGLIVNTVYYLVPISATTYKIATTPANAILGASTAGASGCIDIGVADITVAMVFIPFIHATTGPILTAFLQPGARFCARVQPFSISPNGKLALGGGQTVPQPIGSVYGSGVGVGGGVTTNIAMVPGRYLCLQVVPSATLSAGTYTVDLALNTQAGLRHTQSGFEVR